MKKIILILAVVLTTTVFTSNANAQSKGQLGVGANFEIGTGEDYTNYGIGFKFQYTPINNLRLEPSITYFFEKDYIDSWDFTANVHYLFNAANNLYLYPIAGIGATGYRVNSKFADYSETKFAFNFGAGAEVMVSSAVGLNFEYKYRIVDDWNRSHITLGCVYKF